MSAVEDVVTEAPAVEAVPKRAMTLGYGTSLVVLILLLATPLFVKNFIIFQMTMLLIYGLAVLAVNILTVVVQGLVETKQDAPYGLPLSQDMWLYYFTLVVTVAIYIFSVNLLKSRSGRAFMAIRDNEIAASAMGIDVALYKTLAFGVSAGITGVAGGLGAIAVQFVAPDGYTIAFAISLFLGMVVGGVGWLPGSIVGAAFIIFVPNVAEHISKGLSGAVFGVLLFLVIFLVPHGERQVAIVAQQLIGKLKK